MDTSKARSSDGDASVLEQNSTTSADVGTASASVSVKTASASETPKISDVVPSPHVSRGATGRLRVYTRQHLDNSASRRHNIDQQEENRLRSSACTFIAAAGKELQFKQLAIATASVYFHSFFVKFSFKRFDRYEIAAVCLFLAGKVEEQRRKVKDVADICYFVRHRQRLPPESPKLKDICERMLDKELMVLQVIEFNFHPSHPYHYCMTTLKKIFVQSEKEHKPLSKEDQKEIAQYAWYLINDSLKSTMCLSFRPEPIALACIDAAARLINQQRQVINFQPDWYKSYYKDMDEAVCKEICQRLLDMIEMDPSSRKGGDRQLLRKRLFLVAGMETNESSSHADEKDSVDQRGSSPAKATSDVVEVSKSMPEEGDSPSHKRPRNK